MYEDDMPTPCQRCDDIFDLNDGYPSYKWYPNTVICPACHRLEEEIIEIEDEIEYIQDSIEMEIVGKREGYKQIKELKEKLKKLED